MVGLAPLLPAEFVVLEIVHQRRAAEVPSIRGPGAVLLVLLMLMAGSARRSAPSRSRGPLRRGESARM